MAPKSQRAEDAGLSRGPGGACLPGTSVDWIDPLIALCIAAVAAAVYVATLAPGLLGADSGEFQTLAVTWGYAHPTGSPVYVLLAWLAAKLPVGDVAYRVNLLSAITGAAATGLLYLLAKSLVGRRWIAVAGAAALAVSPAFWSQAIVAGVHTTALLFMLLSLICLSWWQQDGRPRWLFAGACLGACGLGVHASVALIAPPALVLLALTPQRRMANVTAAVLGTLVGLAALLAAFWTIDRADSPSSHFRTAVSPSRSVWDLEPEDLDDFYDRVRLSIVAPQYRDLFFSAPAETTRQKAADYLANLPREFPPLWLAAATGGLFWLGWKAWKMTLLLALACAVHLAVDLHYNTPRVHELYIATYVPIAVFGIAGLALAGDAWTVLSRRLGRDRPSPAGTNALLGILGLAVVVSPMLFPAAWNAEGRRQCWVPPEEEPFQVEYSTEFHAQIRRLVAGLEDDAVLFTGWSTLYPCYYVANVEQGRTRMTFIQDYPHPYYFDLADSALEYVIQLAPARPVYFTHVVGKVDAIFELKPIRCGQQTLYRVGEPIRPAAVNNDQTG